MTLGPSFSLRRLQASDAPAYRDIRLEGLRDAPASFGASWEDEARQPLAWFADRLGHAIVLGGLGGDGGLCGVVGLLPEPSAKLRHKALLWGMFVRPAARGRGLAEALIRRVIAEAPAGVEEIRLVVGAANGPAISLYRRLGFVQYGLEPRALKVEGIYHDEVLMARPSAG